MHTFQTLALILSLLISLTVWTPANQDEKVRSAEGTATAQNSGSKAAEEKVLPSKETWIGWAFLANGNDLPLRFNIRISDQKVEASFDSVTEKAFGQPVADVEWNSSTIRLSWTSPSGAQITLQGKRAAGTIRGNILLGKEPGTFELIYSPHSIADIEPQKYDDTAGSYERAPGDIIQISPRPWGEMLYKERRTGRIRTLLPLGADKFFIGSALYTPAPVDAYLQFRRDASGQIRELIETMPNGSQRRFKRLVIREEAVEFSSEGTLLKGTLMIPRAHGRLPAIVVLGGSGWEKRNDVRSRAAMLSALGFVTLSYDNRGFGESGGEEIVSFQTAARDILAAVNLLKNRKEVNPQAIGAFGESRSGWTAPLAHSLSQDIRFLILFVPPAVSPAEQETNSRLAQMRAAGFSKADLDLAARLIEATWRWVRSADNWEQYASLRSEAVDRKLPRYVFESDKNVPEEWKWARLNMFFEPCPVLSRIRVPVLAIFGGNDLYVSEAINRPRFIQCLSSEGKKKATTYTIPGAEHNLALPINLPIHRLTGTGDGWFPLLADWVFEHFPALRSNH